MYREAVLSDRSPVHDLAWRSAKAVAYQARGTCLAIRLLRSSVHGGSNSLRAHRTSQLACGSERQWAMWVAQIKAHYIIVCIRV